MAKLVEDCGTINLGDAVDGAIDNPLSFEPNSFEKSKVE